MTRQGFHIVSAIIAVIQRRAFYLTQVVRQLRQFLERRLDFLFVVDVLRDMRAHDEQGGHIHRGLGVVGLLEPPARTRHDPRVFVGEIDLIFGKSRQLHP